MIEASSLIAHTIGHHRDSKPANLFVLQIRASNGGGAE